jgi:hypothetical protein
MHPNEAIPMRFATVESERRERKKRMRNQKIINSNWMGEVEGEFSSLRCRPFGFFWSVAAVTTLGNRAAEGSKGFTLV